MTITFSILFMHKLNSFTLFQTLYLQNNKLKQLPSTMGTLANLRTLNLAHNLIKELPPSISALTNLQSLDLRENPRLKRLPAEVARLQCLDTLLLDPLHIVYPSPELAQQGTESVMRFLCAGLS